MGALPCPRLPPGPHRDLVETLHELHHRAGWPSLRTLAAQVGCSHTTVATSLSSSRIPSWGILELLVEALGGDVERARALWLAATALADPGSTDEQPIAGRRTELGAVRRCLTGGAGRMLMVVGEAGVGKSRLVTAASARLDDDTFVAPGWSLALSSEVPLLPVLSALRAVQQEDPGWLERALAASPRYVRATMVRLLPELASGPREGYDDRDGSGRMQLLEAVRTALTGLARERPLAVVIEDLHWADAVTLDLLEYLAVQPAGAAIVMIWRSVDLSTEPASVRWFWRMQRLPAVETLELGPLGPGETAAQLASLGVQDPRTVERIQRRSGGLPLFTEQLAAQHEQDQALPGVLQDLLDQRLEGLQGPAWPVARDLAVADRALPSGLLVTTTGLAGTEVSDGLRALGDRRLLAPSTGSDVAVRHPLLAEAIRRRLTALERVEAHRCLARALGAAPEASAAEVAEHWQRAGVVEPELVWRIRAARQAHTLYALDQELAQWRRALAIWPRDLPPERTLGTGLLDAYLAAYDALAGSDLPAAAGLLHDAMVALPDVDGLGAAELQRRAAETQGKLGDPVGAMTALGRALAIYEAAPPCVGYVHALTLYDVLTWALDRFDDGVAACAKGVEVSAGLHDVPLHRQMLAIQARHDVDSGDLGTALRRIRAAAALHAAGPDPRVDVLVALLHTDILLVTGAPVEAVLAAGRPGFRAAREWGLDTTWTAILTGNVAQALRRAGRVEEAARLVDPAVESRRPSTAPVLLVERAHLDLLRGRTAEAAARITGVLDGYLSDVTERVDAVCAAVTIDLWSGRAEPAHRRAVTTLREVAWVRDPSTEVGRLLVLAARAAADLGGQGHARRQRVDALSALLARTAADPFASHRTIAVRPAVASTWAAEMARAREVPALEQWSVAASSWDRLGRPHESGYCRWRAGQEAVATGRRNLATRLLRHAARDARGHVPLLAAIEATTTLP